MPDHLHALVSFPDNFYLKKRIATFKSWTTKHAGIVWQRDFFDHRLRSVEEAVAKRSYIEMNPVRGGLCLRRSGRLALSLEGETHRP